MDSMRHEDDDDWSRMKMENEKRKDENKITKVQMYEIVYMGRLRGELSTQTKFAVTSNS